MIVDTRVKPYANEKQKVLLEKHFGSGIFIYNHFLEEHSGDRSNKSMTDISKIQACEDR
ncbi:MAG: helix-turn-helix domain-containing protein [Thermoplasmata archaeon]